MGLLLSAVYRFRFPVKVISKSNEKSYGRSGRFFLSKEFKDYEKILKSSALIQINAFAWKDIFPFKNIVSVDLFCFFTDKRHVDGGNATKSIFDAFNGILWVDDRQIKIHSVRMLEGCKDNKFILDVKSISREELCEGIQFF